MIDQEEKPLFETTGGIHIGDDFMRSFQASWPFGKIEIYEDRIVLKVQYLPDFVLNLFRMFGKLPGMLGAHESIPTTITLRYEEVSGYKETNASFMGYGITFKHTNIQYPPFLQFWALWKGKGKVIVNYLNRRGVSKSQ